MGKTLVGKLISYWIFIFGGFFFGKIFGAFGDSKSTIIFLVVLTLVFWGFEFIKHSVDVRKGRA